MIDPARTKVRVWDPVVRLVHWSLVAIVVSNQFINETGGDWHARFGYVACGLVALRLIWGFVGSAHARFSDVVAGWPRRGEWGAHLRSYLRGRAPRSLNHSPLASFVMVAMVTCILALGMSGWMMSWDRYFGEEWVEELHGVLSYGLLALVGLHVLGVVRESVLHRENLVAAMVHGRKRKG